MSERFVGLELLSQNCTRSTDSVEQLSSSIVTVAMPPSGNVDNLIRNLKDSNGRRFIVKNMIHHKGDNVPSIFSNALRVSFHVYNSAQDTTLFLQTLETALEKEIL